MSNIEGIRDTLIERAGLTTEKVEAAKKKSPLDVSFGLVLGILKDIQHTKSMLYGDYISSTRNDSSSFRLIQHYCDIKRKYTRADNFIRQHAKGGKTDLNDLLDTYADLAVYSVFGIQLISTLIEIEKAKIRELQNDKNNNKSQ